MDLGRLSDARDSFAFAAQLDPGNTDVLCQLGEVQAALGEFLAARQSAAQALALDAGHLPSRQLLARLAAPPQIAGPAGGQGRKNR
jgi:cytochrome c-type biogenesis protein CcmH/NrfG